MFVYAKLKPKQSNSMGKIEAHIVNLITNETFYCCIEHTYRKLANERTICTEQNERMKFHIY